MSNANHKKNTMGGQSNNKEISYYALIGAYMLLLAMNASWAMIGSDWAAVNAGAVIAIAAGLWYVT